jgi:glutathione-regulated potassium-efflux system ancillary protein KefF
MVRGNLGAPARRAPPTHPDLAFSMADIAVIAAHPQLEHSRITRALAQAADAARVDWRDIYRLYPDYVIDVPAEQQALAEARLVVWLHPIHWYSMPALMKLWLDEVFSFGWAYGPGGSALRGKDLWLATSTGGSESSYRPDGHNRHFFDAFMHPYEQTAALAGMRWLPPLVLHGAHRVDAPALQAHAAVFAERLARYPDWPEIAGLEPDRECAVAADERPATVEAV